MMRKKVLSRLFYIVVAGCFIYVFFTIVTLLYRNGDGQHAIPHNEQLMDQSLEYFQHELKLQKSFPILINGYGMLIHDHLGNQVNTESFNYNGDSFNFFLTTVNSTFEDEQSLLFIFAEDRLQSYYVDHDSKPTLFYPYTLNQQSYLHIPISFHPTITGENMPLHFVQIMSLDRLPDEESTVDHFVHSLSSTIETTKEHQITAPLPFSGRIPATPKRSGIEGYNLEEHINMGFSSIGFEANDYDGFGFANYDAFITVDSSERKVFFEAFGSPGEYVTVIFLNHEPLEWDGHSAVTWSIEADEMITFDFELPETLKAGDYQLYSISFPLNDRQSLRRPVSSQKYVLSILP